LAQFWDGRAATLEEQAIIPMESPFEMGNTHQGVVAMLNGIAGYRAMFAKAFGSDGVYIERVTMAIACFERTLLSGNSPYDRYKRGEATALTAEQVRGMAVFFDKASCDRCHQGSNFTSSAYANEGVGTDKPEPNSAGSKITHFYAQMPADAVGRSPLLPLSNGPIHLARQPGAGQLPVAHDALI
jgi:cytochrome c peroxidase